MSGSMLSGFVAVALGFLGMAGTALGTTYYVSNEGNDGGDGLTEATSLATIAGVAGRVQRGDRILLRRGDVFCESVEIDTPAVEINAYGSADEDLPAVSGSVRITGWQPYKGAVFVAETDAAIGYLFVNGKGMTIARYPNSGWLRTKFWTEDLQERQGRRGRRSIGVNTVITCAALAEHPRNADGYWVGANIKWRHHSWWFEARKVTAYDPVGKIRLADRSFLPHRPRESDTRGWGFYLDNKLEELDAPGEYFFDAQARKVYLWAPDSADPDELLVEGSVHSEGLSVKDAVVRNVCFRDQKDVGLAIDARSVVEHCRFEGIGRDATVSERETGGIGLRARPGTRNARVSHNVFRDNFNVAIRWYESPENGGSSVIERNELRNTGVVDGYGGSGSWHGAGIIISKGTNVHIRHNRIDGTGYAGIILGSDGCFAEYNVITNAMATLNDGAGIYTNCSRSTIRHNIILDTKGGMVSSGTWPNISHGIWPEFLRDFRESVIEGNTCARSGADGIFLPNNFECVVRDNVLFGNRRYQLLLFGNEGRGQVNVRQDHLIAGNILYCTQEGQKAVYFDPRNDYGVLKGNYYCNPRGEMLFEKGEKWPGSGPSADLTLKQWQEEFAWADKEARTDLEKLEREPTDEEPAGRAELFVNDTEVKKTVPLEGTYRDLDGNPVTGGIVLEPFSSQILVLVGRE